MARLKDETLEEHRIRDKAYRLANPEKEKTKRNKYRDRERAAKQPLWTAQSKAWRHKNRNRVLLSSSRVRAKKLGLPFNLEAQDIVIPEVCPVLGIPLRHNENPGPKDNSPSLDRIVPELGYVKGNVRVISIRANTIKSNATLEELLAVVEYVKNPHR